MKSTWTHLPDSMQTLPQPVDHKDGWIRLPQGDTWGEKHPSISKTMPSHQMESNIILEIYIFTHRRVSVPNRRTPVLDRGSSSLP